MEQSRVPKQSGKDFRTVKRYTRANKVEKSITSSDDASKLKFST